MLTAGLSVLGVTGKFSSLGAPRMGKQGLREH